MTFDVVILGAGAAGLMCGIESAKRKKNVLIIEKSQKIGEKIRISGGGRCNFTNINTHHSKFISKNPSFVISSLNQYSHLDFIELVNKYKISFHERKLGQLFCDGPSQQIIDLLLSECQKNHVRIEISTFAEKIEKKNNLFFLKLSSGTIISTKSLVIATGGLSIPKIGATDFGYSIAKQFDLKVIPTKPALVPFILNNETLTMCRELSGISIDSKVSFEKTSFNEDLLFTHRGLSGPSILQISSYWKENNFINININPEIDYCKYLLDIKLSNINIFSNKSNCEDTYNFIRSTGTVKEVVIENSRSDAIDGDFSSINFKSIKINNTINDCLDFSYGSYFIENAILEKCGDKGLSAGENSKVEVKKINVLNSTIGVASKDYSITKANSVFIKNVKSCLELYNKKQEFSGASLFIDKFFCEDFKKKYDADKTSFLEIKNN